jgi:hypothetical protein
VDGPLADLAVELGAGAKLDVAVAALVLEIAAGPVAGADVVEAVDVAAGAGLTLAGAGDVAAAVAEGGVVADDRQLALGAEGVVRQLGAAQDVVAD